MPKASFSCEDSLHMRISLEIVTVFKSNFDSNSGK